MRKRFLSAFITLCMVLSLLPISAVAAEAIPTSGTCGDNINWYLQQDGTLLLDGSGETYTYGGYWFQPPAPWSELADKIKTIKVQGNITYLGAGLFNECTSAVGITLPESLEYIHWDAWPDGNNLQFVVTGSQGRYIAYEGVLYGTQDPSGWDASTAPENAVFCLIYFPPSANYTSYTLRDETEGIVSLCSKNLKKLTLNKNLKTINSISCPQLTELEIPNGVTEIGALTFSGCTSLHELRLPSTISKLDLSAFWNCNSLESVVIPASVKEVSCDVYPSETSYDDYTQHRDFYFCGDAPKMDSAIFMVDDVDTEAYNMVAIRTDIYYPSNASGWAKLVQSYGDSEGIKFYPYTPSSESDTTATITNLSPANGATAVGYAANSPKRFQITFDREIANDGSIAQVDLSKPGAFSVYRASDNQPVYQSTQYSTYNFLIVYQQENILSIASTELDPGTEYYITLDAGIVAFKDGTTNQAISKGDWGFSTKLFEKEGDFSYLSNDGYDTKYGYSYSDSYFEGLSNKYNHELANMSISLALSAFNSASSLTSGYEHTTAAKNVRALLSDIKFDNLETSSYAGRPGKDTIGVAFGKKEVSYSSGDYTLVAVAIRGAGYEAEWGGNLTVGRKGNHTGFQTAADTVLSRLKEYIKDQEISGDLKIWVTGYSRAAATANLVAAALDDGELFSGANPVSRSSVSLKRTDIYAYTFETPMATTNSNSSAYDNIFNIVNPIDPVPKVAPEGWDFTRYGVTYYMPTSEELTFSDYRNIILRVNTEYANIIKVTPGSSSSFIKALSNQGTVLNSFLDYLSVKLPRNTYSPGYEDLIAPIIAEVTNSGKTDAEAIASIVLEFCVRHPKEAKRIIDALEDAVGSKVFWFVVAEQGFEQLYKILGWEGTTATEVITLLFDTITQSHIPEVTLAWMRTINGADEYGSGMARKLYVNCPVNVSVYDSSNQLVAQIINDEPQLIDDSLIGTYVDGSGQKIIILPNNEKYRIVLTATDDGTVTYTATEYSLDTGNSERVVSYYEVEVINGDELTAIAENLSEVSFAEYPLYINDSNKSLEPTINQIGDDVVEYTVAVTVLGNGETFGGGSYISGEFARVIAEPNSGENFLGWYVDNNLVSSDTEYRFLVEKNVNITAKFTKNIPTTPDAPSNPNPPVHPNPNYPSNGGGGITPATNEITVPSTAGGTVTVSPKSASKGNTVTITATPDPGYELVSLTVTGAGGTIVDVSNVGDGKYTFTMPSGKVTVNTVFSKTWSNPFSDVDESVWYYDAVKFANQNGLMDGVGNGLFAPNANLSRAMLAQILYNKEGRPLVTATSSFSDVVAGAWYANAVTWAATKNIVGGYGNSLFGPGDDITREQFAVILYRYAGSPVPPNLLLDFTDAYKVSDWAQDAIRWAVDQGILNGKGNGILDPTGKATRAEAAQMLKNYFGK